MQQGTLPVPHFKNAAFPLIFGAALLLSAGRVAAIEPIGDDSNIFVTTVVSAGYNDNVFLSHANEVGDEVADFMPGLSYEFGKNNSLTKGKLAYYEDFQFYGDKDGLNQNQLGNGVFSLAYDDSQSKLNFDATYHQADQAEVGIQNAAFLVDRDLYHIDGTGEVQMTPKSSLGSGVIFDDTDYKTSGYTDWRYTEIPVNYYFKYEPKLDLSAGFRYRINTLGAGGVDSTEYFYNVGARGEFTPNLTGQFNIGYNEMLFSGGKTTNGLGADSNFTYTYSPKTSITFGLNSDYGYAATGSAYRNSGVYAGVTSALSDQWSANGRISYNDYAYTTTPQRDNFYSGQVGLTYIFSTYLSANASYTYAEDSSNLALDAFNDSIFTVSASIHY